ncbi:hypothetical protein BGZ65_012833, partial [Modicella reniformis]
MAPSTDSIYGQMAKLNLVWFLDVSTVFHGVPPGRYKIQWKLVLENNDSVLNGLEFRAVVADKDEIPPWDSNGPNAVSVIYREGWQWNHPATMGQSSQDPLLMQVPDILIIDDDHQNVLVQCRCHNTD